MQFGHLESSAYSKDTNCGSTVYLNDECRQGKK
jgi:hypothetical protein